MCVSVEFAMFQNLFAFFCLINSLIHTSVKCHDDVSNECTGCIWCLRDLFWNVPQTYLLFYVFFFLIHWRHCYMLQSENTGVSNDNNDGWIQLSILDSLQRVDTTEASLMLLVTPVLLLQYSDEVECLLWKRPMTSLIWHIHHMNQVQPFSVSRLPSFIRLVDYLVMNTLHMLVVNAVTELLAVLQEKVRQMPSHAIIQSWSQHSEAEMDMKVCFCFSVINRETTVNTMTTKCEIYKCTLSSFEFWLVFVCRY